MPRDRLLISLSARKDSRRTFQNPFDAVSIAFAGPIMYIRPSSPFDDQWLTPQNKNSRVFRPDRSKLSTSRNAKSQPAAFAGSAAFFFWIARFSSNALGDSTSALALSRYASRPPL